MAEFAKKPAKICWIILFRREENIGRGGRDETGGCRRTGGSGKGRS